MILVRIQWILLQLRKLDLLEILGLISARSISRKAADNGV